MSHEPTSIKTYASVFVALLVLLVLTIVAAKVPMPWSWLGPVLAIGIAVAKATLIVLFFMHLKDSVSLVRVVAAAGIVWATFGAALTFADYFTRGWEEAPSPVFAPRAVDRLAPGGERQPAPGHTEPHAPDESSVR